MIEPLRKTHLIRAALQVKGAPEVFILDILAKLEKAAKSPEDFQRWNQLLDPQEIRILRMILSPEGEGFAEVVLSSMIQVIADRHGMSPEEFRWKPGLN